MKIVHEPGSRASDVSNVKSNRLLEFQQIQSQNLKSIGQLAAGIAHEINTPLQYVSDNIYFLENAFGDIGQLMEKYENLFQSIKKGRITRKIIQHVDAATQNSEMDYLREEIPLAITQTLDGLNHVSKIVRAMKEFSHPGLKEKVLIDINQAIKSTLMVSRNEWKYCADIETDLAENLLKVPCLGSEFNQVLLNLIINAADAIKDKQAEGVEARKGKIRISTRRKEPWVEIRISDTGVGIPEEIRPRVFDPFFTTKEVGRGSGQGLNIAYSVIVNKHGGTIRFISETGKGSMFIIRLPMEDELE